MSKLQRKLSKQIDRGFRPGSVARSRVTGAAKKYPAKGQVEVIRIYRKTLVDKFQMKIRFDVFDEADNRRFTSKGYAYSTVEMAGELHLQHGYRVMFDEDTNYPRIVKLVEEVDITVVPSGLTHRLL